MLGFVAWCGIDVLTFTTSPPPPGYLTDLEISIRLYIQSYQHKTYVWRFGGKPPLYWQWLQYSYLLFVVHARIIGTLSAIYVNNTSGILDYLSNLFKTQFPPLYTYDVTRYGPPITRRVVYVTTWRHHSCPVIGREFGFELVAILDKAVVNKVRCMLTLGA